MKLFAISDLHLANKSNKEALMNISDHTEDWLILAGDTGETIEHINIAFTILSQKFKQIVWVPGNHDLWTIPYDKQELKGEFKYNHLVSICRDFGIYTPEDIYQKIELNNQIYIIAPLFTLYDYSFRPENISSEQAIEWAKESGVTCTDEDLLYSEPYNSITEWSNKRCDYTESRLNKLSTNIPLILVNHYPFLIDHAQLWRFPRFALWCGTKRTSGWLEKYNVKVAIYGHMHIRSSSFSNGISFEEVSLGYQGDWDESKGMDYYFKEIIPD